MTTPLHSREIDGLHVDTLGRVRGATPVDRFVSFVAFDDSGCWIWTGKHDRNGYGRFRLDGKWQLAHRVSLALFVEAIPDGMEGDHLCEVKDCVHPDHLEVVTSGTNMRRQQRIGGRAAQTHCLRGHEFTEANTIRDPRNNGRKCRACRNAARRAQKEAS